MGQPITIYKGSQTTTVYGKGHLAEMIAGGWSVDKPKPKPKRTPKKATAKGS